MEAPCKTPNYAFDINRLPARFSNPSNSLRELPSENRVSRILQASSARFHTRFLHIINQPGSEALDPISCLLGALPKLEKKYERDVPVFVVYLGQRDVARRYDEVIEERLRDLLEEFNLRGQAKTDIPVVFLSWPYGSYDAAVNYRFGHFSHAYRSELGFVVLPKSHMTPGASAVAMPTNSQPIPSYPPGSGFNFGPITPPNSVIPAGENPDNNATSHEPTAEEDNAQELKDRETLCRIEHPTLYPRPRSRNTMTQVRQMRSAITKRRADRTTRAVDKQFAEEEAERLENWSPGDRLDLINGGSDDD